VDVNSHFRGGLGEQRPEAERFEALGDSPAERRHPQQSGAEQDGGE
jgi:hypothetical protein